MLSDVVVLFLFDQKYTDIRQVSRMRADKKT